MKNIQKISLIALSIALFGCGGGGSSGDSSDNKVPVKDTIQNNSFDDYVKFNWGSVQFKNTFVEITKYQRNANIEYADYVKLDDETKLFDDRVQLGRDGLYVIDKNKYPLGYRHSFINSVSQDGSSINRSIYNTSNLKKVREEEKGKWIDLKGKKISDHTVITWNAIYETFPNHSLFNPEKIGTQFKSFLALTKTTQFPVGSKCFISESKTYSEPFYIMTNINTTSYVNGQNVKTFDEYVKALGNDKVFDNWGGTSWVYSKNEANDSKYIAVEVAAKINNQLATGYWSKNPNKTSEALIQEYKELLNQPYVSAEDKVFWNAWIKAIQNECTYYNPVAAATIQSLVNQTMK
ncbi:hypothetical protein [Acinetobacter sp. CFCC 10889]|uniref:hypothetical protein n=1 Tax=Acinetobacter sp. CFCC 10889 TaxID=1775557 RepID=UPI000DD0A367|nr:hypothetical protein [Acinetobacter sp. CFCC 10889]